VGGDLKLLSCGIEAGVFLSGRRVFGLPIQATLMTSIQTGLGSKVETAVADAFHYPDLLKYGSRNQRAGALSGHHLVNAKR